MKVMQPSKLRSIKIRIDEVYVHLQRKVQIRGCLFLVEYLLDLYLIWLPYSFLLKIDKDLCVFLNGNGNVITPKDFEGKKKKSTEQPKYVSAKIIGQKNESSKSPKYTKTKTNIDYSENQSNDEYLKEYEIIEKHFDSNQLHSFIVKVSEINSIKKYLPTIGWSYISITLTNLTELDSLFFHDGGMNEFFTLFSKLVNMSKSPYNSSLYLINSIQKTKSSSNSNESNTINPLKKSIEDSGYANYYKSVYQNTKFKLLQLTSRITKRARKIQTNVSTRSNESKDKIKSSVELVKKDIENTKNENIVLTEKNSKEGVKNEMSVSTTEDGFVLLNEDGHEDLDKMNKERLENVRFQAIETLIRKMKWKDYKEKKITRKRFCSIYYDEKTGCVKNFNELKSDIFYGGIFHIPSAPIVVKESEKKFFTEDTDDYNAIVEVDEMKMEVEHKVSDDMRRFLWPFLLEVYPVNSTHIERVKIYEKKRNEYYTMKTQWKSVSNEQLDNWSIFRTRLKNIEKDVLRTDRLYVDFVRFNSPCMKKLRNILITYSFFNFDIGYCQGMNDVLAPILVVLKDEALSFWCFANIMKKIGNNFSKDHNSMDIFLSNLLSVIKLLDYEFWNFLEITESTNLFFCFRWILVLFKREFTFHDTMRIWDSIFSEKLQINNLHFSSPIFIAYAMLANERDTIIEKKFASDQLFKYCIELVEKLDKVEILKKAEIAYHQYEQKIKQVEKNEIKDNV